MQLNMPCHKMGNNGTGATQSAYQLQRVIFVVVDKVTPPPTPGGMGSRKFYFGVEWGTLEPPFFSTPQEGAPRARSLVAIFFMHI